MKDGIARLALDQLDPALAATLKPTVERLGYLGEFFQVAAHVPDGVRAFMEYTKAVKAPLPDNLNELLALTVCAALGADYERIQHERLAQKLGFSLAWIAAAEGRATDGDVDGALNAQESLLKNLALAVIADHGRATRVSVARVNAALGPEQTVAALLQITRFMMIATLCNALELELPVSSVFDTA